MPDPAFVFDGLEPWRPDAGLIECLVGPWLLDLHNFAAFLGYTFRADGLLTLSWYHHQPGSGPPPGDGGRAALTFRLADSELSFTASGVRVRLVPSDVRTTFG